MDGTEPRRTPLEADHVALGAKLGGFAGWRMPIEYGGTVKEHGAVRERVGLFDVSHLGKIEVSGEGALDVLQPVLSNDIGTMAVGRALYNLVLNDEAGVVDDLIVYRIAQDRYLLVPNAGNTDKVLALLAESHGGAAVRLLEDRVVLAVQGPDSVSVIRSVFPEVPELDFMTCAPSAFAGQEVIVARSGYTGEVGFELFGHRDVARDLWGRLLAEMEPFGGSPCGLAARDLLRLEMGYPLHGQDLSEATTPIEAGLSWAVAIEKEGFRGREALIRMRDEGPPSRLRGLRMHERRHIPRSHCGVMRGERTIGEVTSGTFSPLLRTGIALASMRPADVVNVGDQVEVEIRGRRGVAEVVRTPFVDRSPR